MYISEIVYSFPFKSRRDKKKIGRGKKNESKCVVRRVTTFAYSPCSLRLGFKHNLLLFLLVAHNSGKASMRQRQLAMAQQHHRPILRHHFRRHRLDARQPRQPHLLESFEAKEFLGVDVTQPKDASAAAEAENLARKREKRQRRRKIKRKRFEEEDRVENREGFEGGTHGRGGRRRGA